MTATAAPRAQDDAAATAAPDDTVATAALDAPATGPAIRSVPPRVRAALAVVAAAVAFAPSLSGLVADLRYGAPTGDLVAVPLVVAVMLDAVVRARRTAWVGRLGHGDLVAAGLLSGTALLLIVLPSRSATNGQWLARLDLLAYPLVVAAFAVLLLGLRVLAVGLVPLGFGLLVWPWPVTWLNVHAVAPLTTVTYQVSGRAAELLGVAEMVDVGAENTLRIGSGESGFEVVVAPACSGITGLAAYLVVAGAVLALTTGRLRGRAAWVCCGLVGVWLANVVRIVSLAAAGRAWGSGVALDLLHPVAGLALDALVVAVLVVTMHRFGLQWAPVVRTAPGESPAAGAFTGTLQPPPIRSVLVRAGVVTALTAGLLAAQAGVADPSAGLTASLPSRPVALPDVQRAGVRAEFVGREDWAKAYFGSGSVWNRYRITSTEPGAGPGARPGPQERSLWLDSLTVDDADALRAHDVLGCYGFHGAQVVDGGPVRVGGRFVARLLVVRQPSGEQWQSLYWEWPVRQPAGLRHERVTLFVGGAPIPNTGGAPTWSGTAAQGAAGGPEAAIDADLTRALRTAADRVVSAVLTHPTADLTADPTADPTADKAADPAATDLEPR